MEKIDDLLPTIPPGWDFWIGSDWDANTGETSFCARLNRRALGDYLHLGHYLHEVEKESTSLREALVSAVAEARQFDTANGLSTPEKKP